VPTRPAYSSLPSSSWKPNKRDPGKGAGPFRVRPADEGFEAVSVGGAAEGLAVAAIMIAEFDSVERFRKERSQAALSLAERKGHQIFVFDLEEVEGERPNRRPRARRLAA
jgi:hypothetical protein